jgi:hypothetical protein
MSTVRDRVARPIPEAQPLTTAALPSTSIGYSLYGESCGSHYLSPLYDLPNNFVTWLCTSAAWSLHVR